MEVLIIGKGVLLVFVILVIDVFDWKNFIVVEEICEVVVILGFF